MKVRVCLVDLVTQWRELSSTSLRPPSSLRPFVLRNPIDLTLIDAHGWLSSCDSSSFDPSADPSWTRIRSVPAPNSRLVSSRS